MEDREKLQVKIDKAIDMLKRNIDTVPSHGCQRNEVLAVLEHEPETFHLVEYATHATYYKVDANSFEDACDLVENGNTDEGIVSIDRSDVFIDHTGKEIYDAMKQKNDVMQVRS